MILIVDNSLAFVGLFFLGLGPPSEIVRVDRDGSRLKVIPEEYERRRAIFWVS